MLYYITIILVLVGLSASTPLEGRVIDGTVVPVGVDTKFMASVRINNVHQCGGTIIDSSRILTAAHCVYEATPSSVTVQTGVKNILNGVGVISIVANIIIHPDFYPQLSTKHDIALLKLQNTLAFSATVGAVTLPAKYQQTPAALNGGILMGWGSITTATGGQSNNLRRATLDLISNPDCAATHLNPIYSTNICAGVANGGGGKGQCSKDGGGPLLVGNNVQVGIVSWSVKPCAVAPYPGVYTRVSHYICWIEANP